MSARGQFSSRTGFIMAAAGSAIGLGNIWGFPTNVADNGGAAFVFVYVILTFLLAYPVLMAELTIGRYSRSNMVDGLAKISSGAKSRHAGHWIGTWALIVASLILAFYTIVAGWMLAFGLEAVSSLLGLQGISAWLTEFGTARNLIFGGLFACLTVGIIRGGVSEGIEKWSTRLMPMLLVIIVLLISYVATLDGAAEGWRIYIIPDFARTINPDLLIAAMGQAFFSLSLGVGTMFIYGSYIPKDQNLPGLGASVTVVDIGVAILAGLLVIPAMYVAQHNGVQIYSDTGELLAGDTLIFTVLPALFETMGAAGYLAAFAFFALMSIAALTSSISMLEVPVCYTIERYDVDRHRATWVVAGIIFAASCVIMLNFDALFGLVVDLTTRYSEPFLGLCLCIFAGWIWRRDVILNELSQGHPDIERSLFWKIWPSYVRFVCPLLIALVFYQSIFG